MSQNPSPSERAREPEYQPPAEHARCVVESGAFTDAAHLETWNQRLAGLDARGRVQCALAHLPGTHVLTSSFGAQAAVSLHLLTREVPDMPVILLDTGYLFPETYQFVEQLTERLKLKLKVYRSPRSAAWQEAVHGQRWLQGVEGLDAYNQENKVEPLQRALDELEVGTWFTGLRRDQASTRAATPFVQYTGRYFKVSPIADWTDRDVFAYLKAHRLPYHPLWEQGYVSIGDTHTTVPLHQADSAEETRFFGLKRECGIHEMG
ncbi:MAG: phosphoadenylyl-sulfate reductase [Pseudomonadales bacterium]